MAKWLMVSDVVHMLHVPEATVYRWIRQGDIPCIVRRGKHYFNQSTLLTWADSKHIFLKEKISAKNKIEKRIIPKSLPLVNSLKAGNVFKKVPSITMETLFKEIAFLLNLPKNVKEILPDLLEQREILSSTGIGNGIAIPHPKIQIGTEIFQSMVGTFFLETPLEFKASDGIPVFVVFVIISKNSSNHLKLLSQLTNFLNHSNTINFLKQEPSLENIIDQLQKTLEETS